MFAAAQIKLPLKNIENLLNLGVVMRARVESRCDRKLKQRALLGMFGCYQIIKCESDAALLRGPHRDGG
jgi:hypothetical protein